MGLQDQVVQYLMTGITIGSIYALVAVGFVIIYNVTGVLNFAQGEFVMLGAMVAVTLVENSVPLLISLILAVVAVSFVGALIERTTIFPARNASIAGLIMITIGVSIILRGAALLAWGWQAKPLPSFSGDDPLRFLGATISPQTLWILGVGIVIAALLYVFFERTLLGKALTACAFDALEARLVGISTNNMRLLSFALGAALGAIAGIMIAPIAMPSYSMGTMLSVKGFVAATIGGLNSVSGAIVGGILLGILEGYAAGLVSSGFKDAIALVVLLAIIFLRPGGLLGRLDIRRSGL